MIEWRDEPDSDYNVVVKKQEDGKEREGEWSNTKYGGRDSSE